MKRKTMACLIGLFMSLGVGVCFVAQAPGADFPTQNIRLLVGAKPGGGMDLYARALGRYIK